MGAYAQQNPLNDLLQQHPFLWNIAENPDHQVQILYTQIEREGDNRARFRTFSYGLDTSLYFYPASTVKMPVAFLALERLNDLDIKGLDKDTWMRHKAGSPPQTAVKMDTTSQNWFPSVGHYIKKIFLVSDNDAYNRLYEFLGQAYINEQLWRKGYERLRIIHRLSAPDFDTLSNRITNPVEFVHPDEHIFYQQAESYSRAYKDLGLEGQIRGKAYVDNTGQLVKEPFDFRYKNYVGLQELHDILKAVLFPDAVPEASRFRLKEEDYTFLYRYLSMLPQESDYPSYEVQDSYVKFFIFGDSEAPMPRYIRLFNKVGDAYGFLTDVAYVVDFENGVEFFLAANIHVNANESFNDGEYEYEEIGFPFLAQLGRAIYQMELERPRKYLPDLFRFKVEYQKK